MLIYFCPYALDASLVGVGGPCSEVHPNITGCRRGLPIGAWAVGGEVNLIAAMVLLLGDFGPNKINGIPGYLNN
jgi:hypothetical protein